MRHPRSIRSLLMTTACAMLTACSAALASPAAQPVPAVKSLSDVKAMVSATLPAGAKEISVAASTAKAGETVIVHGYVPDAPDAFSASSAEFRLVESLPAPGQSAPAAAPVRATIRLLGDAGQPFKVSLKDQYGLKPGAEVFVTGVVVSADGKGEIVLAMTALHVPRASLPSGFFTDAPADGARDISEARKAGTLKAGDRVVLRGRVGGSTEPFVAGRAVFTLMGRGLKACSENPGDACKKPWDYCCETKADILAHSVTVQVVDAKSQVLRTDMKGRRGLKEMSEIVVVGTIAVADGKAVVVNATSMHVVAN